MRIFLYFATILLLLWPGVARAEPTYPAEIQAHLGLNYTPPCTLCHATNAGGGSVVTPFANAMVAAGLTTDINTLDPALDALDKAGVDSSGDGIPDIQQLKEGLDPNTGLPLNVQQEQYGCARIAKRSARPAGHKLILIGLAFWVLNRRRVRRCLCQSSAPDGSG